MSKAWEVLRQAVHSTNNIANQRAPAYKYSARASYDFESSGYRQGMCVDIDPKNTVGCAMKSKSMQWGFIVYIYVGVAAACTLLFYPAHSFLRKVGCCIVGCIAISMPFICILNTNKQLFWRIMCKSMLPWIKLYMCSVETYCLCDLCAWSWRAIAVAPILWSSQLTVFMSDAIYFRRRQRYMIMSLLALFILFRVFLLLGVRFLWFGELTYRTFQFWEINFNNSGTMVAKMLSMILFMCGQLIFKIRHPANLYSLKTSYTVLQNKTWNRLERTKRIERKQSHYDDVRSTEIRLQCTDSS